MPKLISGADLFKVLDGIHKLQALTEQLSGTDPATVERRACADTVRAAGCLCFALVNTKERLAPPCQAEFDWSAGGEVTAHDPRCPTALAAVILARGGAA
jgi:hypothetical protein